VRRDSVGSSAEQIFPRAESFDDDWYPANPEGSTEADFMLFAAKMKAAEREAAAADAAEPASEPATGEGTDESQGSET
jgi:hypothetical protein